MNDMLQYWREMFGEFETTEKVFAIPEFPEPLMSADFNRDFEGIIFRGLKKRNLVIEPLSEALERPLFWKFHEENYPEAVEFLERLLPYLERTKPGRHRHFYFLEGEEMVASQLVGEGEEMSFLFNGVVAKSHRRKGLLNELLASVLVNLRTERAFYWTKFEWLGDKKLEFR